MAQIIILPKPPRKRDAQVIKSAVQQARKMSHFVQQALAEVWNQPGRGPALWTRRKRAFLAEPRFRRWLGDKQLGKEQLQKIHRRLRTIDARLHRTLRYEVRPTDSVNCRKGWIAWHKGVIQKRKTFLCPPFFERRSVQERAGILVHELAHGLGLWKLDARMVGDDAQLQAEKLAGARPRRARNNPSNYEFLFRAFDPRDPL